MRTCAELKLLSKLELQPPGMERLEEAKRWFRQSLRDLKAARDSKASGNHEWAAFQA